MTENYVSSTYEVINNDVDVTTEFALFSDNNSTTGGESRMLQPVDMSELALYVTFEVCIAFFALLSNLLVVVALWKFHSLRTPTNLFVASLAIADIAVAVFAIPSAILLRFGLLIKSDDCVASHELIRPTVIKGISIKNGGCFAMISSVLFLTQVSIFSLLVIAIDRFIAIHYPFRYTTFMTSNRTRVGILAVWVMGAVIGIAPELWWNKTKRVDKPCNVCAFEDVISMEYMVYFNFFGCVLTPLIAMGVIYLFIFRSAKKQLQKIYADVRKGKISKSVRRSLEKNQRLNGHRAVASFTTGYETNSVKTLKQDIPLKITITQPCSRDDESLTCGASPLYDERATSTEILNTSSNNSLESPMESINKEFQKETFNNSKGSQVDNIPSENCGNSSSSVSVTSAQDDGSSTNSKNKEFHPEIVGRDAVSMENLHETNENHQGISPKSVDHIQCNSQTQEVSCGQEEIRTTQYASISRHRGKSHSFSASSSIMRVPSVKLKKMCYQIKATPLSKLANEDASSVMSSRSTVYNSEHGVWTIVGQEQNNNDRLAYQMKRKSQFLKKEFKAARSLATVVGLFALCWLPLHILNSVTLFCPDCHQGTLMKDVAILLSHANSLINPLIYAFKLKDFKNAFRKILSRTMTSFNQDYDATRTNKKQRHSIFKRCCFFTSKNSPKVDFNSSTSDDRKDYCDDRRYHVTPHSNGIVSEFANNNNNNSKSRKSCPRSCVSMTHCFHHKRNENEKSWQRKDTETFIISFKESSSTKEYSSLLPNQNDGTEASSSGCNSNLSDDLFSALLNSEETTL